MLEAAAGTAGLHTIYTGPASGLRRGGLPWEPDPREEDGDGRPDPAVAGAEAGQPGASRARPAVPAAGPRARGDRGRDLGPGTEAAVESFQHADLLKSTDRRPGHLAGPGQRHALALRVESTLIHRFAGLQGHRADVTCVTHGK